MRIGKEVLILNLDDVLPNRFQPRITFDEKAIMELTESIKEHGVIQPIVVRRIADKYEIIAGERRYKASVLAGKATIPAILADLNDKDSAEVALIENIQRQDLTPIEEAVSYKKILDMGYLNQVDLANKLGKTQSTIANKLRLLNLSDEVQEALLKEKISERHARSLLKLNEEQQKIMLNRIIIERLTVRKTDEEIEKMLAEEPNTTGDAKTIEHLDLTIEEKGEKNMNNDNNEINVVPEVKVESPIFPSFTTTNINESKPINFGFNNEMNNEQPQPEPINLTGIENNVINEPVFEQQPEIPVQPQPEKVTDFSTIFGNPTVSENVESTPVQTNSFNSFFGNFNGDLLNKIESESQVEETIEPQQVDLPINPAEIPQTEVPQMNVEPEFNNGVLGFENEISNQLPNEVSNETIVEENNIINEPVFEPQTDIPVQPVMPQIEELNFEEEITPIKSFSLDDEDEFNNLSTQILSTSQTPVQIITPEEVPELQPIMPEQNFEKIGSLNEMINKIRDVLDNIEQCGYKIDSDEMDLENSYQITITIEK